MTDYKTKGVANENEEKMQILDKKSYNPNIEETSCFLSRWFFCYTRKIMQKGARLERQKQYLTANDLFECDSTTKPEYQQNQIREFQKKVDQGTVNNKKQGFYTQVLWMVINKQHRVAGFLAVIGNLLQFAGPIFLKLILEYLEEEDSENDYIGYIWATCILFCFFLRIFIMQNALNMVNAYSMRILNGTSGLLIEKILRISTASRKYFEGGRIMNFITVDQQMVFMFAQMSTFLFSSPLMIIVSMVLIIFEVGWIGLITPLIFIFSFIFQSKLNGYLYALRNNIMKWKDRRAKAVYEYFNGIKIIKYYAWEEVVYKKVREIRKHETKYLMDNQKYRTVIDLIVNQTPLVLSIIVFTVYIASDNELKPSKAYSVLAVFNLMMLPVRMVMFTFMMYMNSKSSKNRIDHFIETDEREKLALVDNQQLEKGQIQIKEGTFAWETIESKLHDIQGKKQNRNPKFKEKNKKQEEQDEQELQTLKNKNLDILENINFTAKSSELIAIVGRVAAGKTSFLHALLGELHKTKGTVEKNGTIAYVSQQAWLRNASLRDNVLFGKPYDEKFYNKVLDLCELKSDIEILPGGDLVEIGERGVNLSGGQKQRVAIARAIYSNADIYIIDDCLSALDAHVGKNIFHNVFKKLIAHKTVIFVTHALHLLPEFDRIIVMSKGKIVETGTFEELSNNKKSEFQDLQVEMKKMEENEQVDELEEGDEEENQQQGNEEDFDMPPEHDGIQRQQSANEKSIKLEFKQSAVSQQPQDLALVKKQSSTKKSMQSYGSKPGQLRRRNSSELESIKKRDEKQLQKGAMVQKEERAVGAVPWKVYTDYMASGGKCTTFWVFFSLVIAQISRIMTDWWIGQWAEDNFDLDDLYYILIYFGLGIVVGIFFYIRGIIFAIFTLKSADNYQAKLMDKLLRTPMYWFDTTPTGRIISRTTKDQDDIDSQLPWSLQMALQNIIMLIGALILICIILPFFIIVAIISAFVFTKAVGYYLISAREIKRLESLAKAPVISNFQEVISGTYIIRAFNMQKFFIDRYLEEQHRYIVSFVNFNYTQRWISVQTDLFALIIIVATCYFAVLSKEQNYVSDSSLMGLCITWAFQISTLLSFTLKMVADSEAQMNALVRMLQYIKENPQEADWKTSPELLNQESFKNWPTKGEYDIQNITYKYRDDLPNVIHGISYKIQSKEKVGIVGRTGSGKSTMTLGLMRILELSKDPQNQLGQILLDGIDISKVGLHNLREKVTIIPQDPILFTGTLRFNLDPHEKFTDEQIVDSLKQVQMWELLDDILQKNQENKQKAPGAAGAAAPSQNQLTDQQKVQQKDEEKANLLDDIKTKLNLEIQDGGENFSLGQRQLVCMARALVRQPKVLLMDEATASIDEKTDHLIQKMIKSVFKDTTVITIAHRINTIMQYDKIIVLDDGNIVEIDSPLNLLKKQGLFSSLVDEGGKEFREKMIFLAENKEKHLEDYN